METKKRKVTESPLYADVLRRYSLTQAIPEYVKSLADQGASTQDAFEMLIALQVQFGQRLTNKIEYKPAKIVATNVEGKRRERQEETFEQGRVELVNFLEAAIKTLGSNIPGGRLEKPIIRRNALDILLNGELVSMKELVKAVHEQVIRPDLQIAILEVLAIAVEEYYSHSAGSFPLRVTGTAQRYIVEFKAHIQQIAESKPEIGNLTPAMMDIEEQLRPLAELNSLFSDLDKYLKLFGYYNGENLSSVISLQAALEKMSISKAELQLSLRTIGLQVLEDESSPIYIIDLLDSSTPPDSLVMEGLMLEQEWEISQFGGDLYDSIIAVSQANPNLCVLPENHERVKVYCNIMAEKWIFGEELSEYMFYDGLRDMFDATDILPPPVKKGDRIQRLQILGKRTTLAERVRDHFLQLREESGRAGLSQRPLSLRLPLQELHDIFGRTALERTQGENALISCVRKVAEEYGNQRAIELHKLIRSYRIRTIEGLGSFFDRLEQGLTHFKALIQKLLQYDGEITKAQLLELALAYLSDKSSFTYQAKNILGISLPEDLQGTLEVADDMQEKKDILAHINQILGQYFISAEYLVLLKMTATELELYLNMNEGEEKVGTTFEGDVEEWRRSQQEG